MSEKITLELALEYHNMGFNVVPTEKLRKYPITGWEHYQYQQQTPENLRAMNWKTATGIAAICGTVSGNLVCVDFDNLPFSVVEEFLRHANIPDDYAWIIKTASGEGYHVWLRSNDLQLPSSSSNILDRLSRYQDGGEAKQHIELRWNEHIALLPPSRVSYDNPRRIGQYKARTILAEPPINIHPNVLLAAYDAMTKPETPTLKTKLPRKRMKFSGDGHPYSNAALQYETDILRNTGEGGRNNQLFQSTASLAGFVAAGVLDRTTVWNAFYQAATDAGLPHHETVSTLESGFATGSANPRSIPERSIPSIRQDTNMNDDTTSIPHPYLVEDGRMFMLKDDIPTRLADYSARITREITEESGGKRYELTGETMHGKSFQFVLDARDFEDTAKLKTSLGVAAGPQAGAAPGKERYLGDAIRSLSSDITTIRLYRRTGWDEHGHFLIPGRPIEDVIVELPSDVPYRFEPSADLHEALVGLEALISSVGPTNSLIPLMAIFGAPMLDIVGWRDERYTTHIAARTGSFKTSWSQAALSIYGSSFVSDRFLIKWGDGATDNAIEKLAAACWDMPLLIDNYKPNTGRGEAGMIRLIHRLTEGSSKRRLDNNASYQVSDAIYATLLITGEDVPGSDTATIARQLWVHFDNQPDNAAELLDRAQKRAKHLNAVGQVWIEYLESEPGRTSVRHIAEKLAEYRNEFQRQLLAHNRNMAQCNPRRLAQNLAISRITFEILLSHPIIGKVFSAFITEYADAIQKTIILMAGVAVSSNPGIVYIESLRELITTGKALLVKEGSKVHLPEDETIARRTIGLADGKGGAFLLPNQTRALIEREFGHEVLGGASPKALYSALSELGCIGSTGKDETTQIKVINGKRVRVLHLNADAFGQE